jgi:hypothetical protein
VDEIGQALGRNAEGQPGCGRRPSTRKRVPPTAKALRGRGPEQGVAVFIAGGLEHQACANSIDGGVLVEQFRHWPIAGHDDPHAVLRAYRYDPSQQINRFRT